ncbi:short-chain oxidoreductase [Gautieria morchelliformis]|nr:short-chain oxidoreductase [Gautieria morchelliformis]
MSKQLVWLITGTSTGFGRDLTLAAMQRGDKVVATARNLSKIHDLREAGADIIELDVTSPLEKLQAITKQAVDIHGRIDVVVNNAAYIAVGALEENTPEETYQQFNTNIFGALNVTRAALPYLRAQKSGTVVWIGSVGGWRGSPNAGLYCATKYAVRGLSETLHAEISPLGLRSICFEPGYFRTSFLEQDHRNAYDPRIADYAEMTSKANDALVAYNGRQPGDPKKLVQVILDVVRVEGVAQGRETPLGLPLGSDSANVIKDTLGRTANILEQWEDVIKSTDFPQGV